MAMHILPIEMPTQAKIATYLGRAANARRSVQDGEWLDSEGERKAKIRARERIAAARAARITNGLYNLG